MGDIPMEVFDAVFDSQHVFRKLLDAMARPGSVEDIGNVSQKFSPAGKMNGAAAAIALALLDEYASFAAMYEAMEEVKQYIKWNTRSPYADMREADYIFVSASVKDSGIMDIFAQAKRGSLLRPDDSATLVIEASGLYEGAKEGGLTLRLKGPGIEDEKICTLDGVSPLWFFKRNDIVSEFPMGVEMVFAASDGRIMAIPRTTKLETDGEWFLWDM